MKTEKLLSIITQTSGLMNVAFFWDYKVYLSSSSNVIIYKIFYQCFNIKGYDSWSLIALILTVYDL